VEARSYSLNSGAVSDEQVKTAGPRISECVVSLSVSLFLVRLAGDAIADDVDLTGEGRPREAVHPDDRDPPAHAGCLPRRHRAQPARGLVVVVEVVRSDDQPIALARSSPAWGTMVSASMGRSS
ncbi:MAG: hypothetical protein OXI15_01490, partial [Chromatiales bacterium]|nr:hypothetical protein [Chromatiales bacterium]